jgi:hypothetical protein
VSTELHLFGGGMLARLPGAWPQWPSDAAEHAGGLSLSPSQWPAQGQLLHWCQQAAPGLAVVLILAGIVYLLFGLSIAKILVTLNATVIGGWLGAELGERAGGSGAALPGAVVAGLLAATIAWPTLKWSVAVLGGMLGLVLGVAAWRLSDLDPSFGWSGGLTGLVLCGLLSLLVFRACVITYTSLQGAAMVVFGTLALILKHEDLGPSLHSQMTGKPFLLPMAIFVPTLIGYIYQRAMSAPAPTPAGPPPPPKKA